MADEKSMIGRGTRRAQRAWTVLRSGGLRAEQDPDLVAARAQIEDLKGRLAKRRAEIKQLRQRKTAARELPTAGKIYQLATGRHPREFLTKDDAADADAILQTALERLQEQRALLSGEIQAGTPEFDAAAENVFAGRKPPSSSPVSGLALLGELAGEGTLESAVARAARRMNVHFGIDVSYGLLRTPLGERLGRLVQGIIGIRRNLHHLAWEAFCEIPTLAIAVAAGEYAKAGLLVEPEVAVPAIEAWLADPDRACDLENEITVLECLLSYERVDEARAGYAAVRERARTIVPTEDDARRLDWLGTWCGPEAGRMSQIPPGAVSFGVMDYKAPEYKAASSNMGDYLQTLASLGHLLRHQKVQIADGAHPGVDAAVRRLQGRVASHHRAAESAEGTVVLTPVDRDASRIAPIPDQTWMLAFGWYAWRSAQAPYQFPFHRSIRPIFISFHVENLDMLTEEAYDYLKQYGPVGCRDWATVWLLLGAGVPAFFSGCLATTAEGFWERDLPREQTGRVAYVDSPVVGDGEFRTQAGEIFRSRPLGWNLDNAYHTLDDYRRDFDRIVSSRLHCYLPMTGLGTEVEFTHAERGDLRFDGLRGLDVAGARAMGARITGLLDPVMRLIIGGAAEADVYAEWARLTEPLVAEAREAFEAPLPPIAAPFDVAAAVREARGGLTGAGPDIEPSAEGRIDLVVAFDYGFRGVAEVSLGSIVANASRPLRLYVLGRDLPVATRERFERLFPEVAFRWYDMSRVDFGPIAGMLRHVSMATMDRLLLPELLPDVDRVVYLDLDTVTEGDLAVLADLPLGGAMVAARGSVSLPARTGLGMFRIMSRRLRRDYLRHDRFARTLGRVYGRNGKAFNAGVLVLDLAGMRRTGFTEQFIGMVAEYGLNDQEVLNLWSAGRSVELPPGWNLFADQEVVREAELVHYAGPRKPWSSDLGAAGRPWQKWSQALAERARAAGVENLAW